MSSCMNPIMTPASHVWLPERGRPSHQHGRTQPISQPGFLDDSSHLTVMVPMPVVVDTIQTIEDLKGKNIYGLEKVFRILFCPQPEINARRKRLQLQQHGPCSRRMPFSKNRLRLRPSWCGTPLCGNPGQTQRREGPLIQPPFLRKLSMGSSCRKSLEKKEALPSHAPSSRPFTLPRQTQCSGYPRFHRRL